MEILLAILIFLTITFLIWGLYLFISKDEGKIEKRLQTLSQDSGFDDKEKVKQSSSNVLFEEVKNRLEKKTWTQKLEKELEKADIPMKGSEMAFLIIVLILIGIVFGWLLWGLLGSLFGGLFGYLFPPLFIRLKQKRRLNQFNQQISDCLVLISNSLKAGFSFFQAIDLVAKEMGAPIANEFSRVLKEMNLGFTVEETLMDMVERVGSDDLDMVIHAVLIQRQVGGNLAEVLDNIGFTIRERIRIKGEIKTLTAQGRMSGFIIALLPVGLSLLLATMNPGYFELLWTTTLGRVFIALAIILEFVGIIIIRKIVNVRI